MHIWHNLADLPTFRNAVITIGSFDGVHLGHQQILQRVNELATACDGERIVITFDPHPRLIVYPDDPAVQLLTTTAQKCRLLAQHKIDHTVLVRFDAAFAAQSPTAYIEHFLVKYFQPKFIVIGYDHHFGKDRVGNMALLQSLAPKYNYEVIEISKQAVDAIAISSTKVREAILNGYIAAANNLLGYAFSITGSVVKGQQIGRTIGYPTANVLPNSPHQIIPNDGIYAAKVIVDNRTYNASLYIGTRPTLNGLTRSIEAHIFDFNKDIYNETIEVVIIAKVRDDKKLDSLAALQAQIAIDNKAVQHLITNYAL
jgi:riboflavin kinase / FMN adenylyltransferase